MRAESLPSLRGQDQHQELFDGFDRRAVPAVSEVIRPSQRVKLVDKLSFDRWKLQRTLYSLTTRVLATFQYVTEIHPMQRSMDITTEYASRSTVEPASQCASQKTVSSN